MYNVIWCVWQHGHDSGWILSYCHSIVWMSLSEHRIIIDIIQKKAIPRSPVQSSQCKSPSKNYSICIVICTTQLFWVIHKSDGGFICFFVNKTTDKHLLLPQVIGQEYNMLIFLIEDDWIISRYTHIILEDNKNDECRVIETYWMVWMCWKIHKMTALGSDSIHDNVLYRASRSTRIYKWTTKQVISS